MPKIEPPPPPEWPHQLRAAASLGLIVAVWLLVLPFAAAAYLALQGAASTRAVLERLRTP